MGRPAGPLQLATMDSFIAGFNVPLANVMKGFPSGGSVSYLEKKIIYQPIITIVLPFHLYCTGEYFVQSNNYRGGKDIEIYLHCSV